MLIDKGHDLARMSDDASELNHEKEVADREAAIEKMTKELDQINDEDEVIH